MFLSLTQLDAPMRYAVVHHMDTNAQGSGALICFVDHCRFFALFWNAYKYDFAVNLWLFSEINNNFRLLLTPKYEAPLNNLKNEVPTSNKTQKFSITKISNSVRLRKHSLFIMRIIIKPINILDWINSELWNVRWYIYLSLDFKNINCFITFHVAQSKTRFTVSLRIYNLFNNAFSVSWTIWQQMKKWHMNDELVSIWKKAVVGYYELLSCICYEGQKQIRKFQPEQPVPEPKFELETSWIRSRKVNHFTTTSKLIQNVFRFAL